MYVRIYIPRNADTEVSLHGDRFTRDTDTDESSATRHEDEKGREKENETEGER